MTDPRCRYVGDDQARMLRTHLKDCNTSGCPGCEPCPERHCQLCNKAHVTVDGRGDDQTCITCLGATRTNLTGILKLCTRLLGEAILRGINSEAAMLIGPAADPEAWGYRRMSALAGRIDPAWLEDCRDELHPTWVLGTWNLLARDHLDQVNGVRPTLTEAKAYLDGKLSHLAHDPTFAFDQLAADVARCHAHLENVLAEGDRPDTGAPCPVCGHKALVKDYGNDPDDDVMWHCPSCDNWWTDKNYRDKILGVYVGVADRLTASQIQQQYHVNESTVRTWADRGKTLNGQVFKVRRRGRDDQGRMLYDVDDVIAVRDAAATRSA